MPAVVGQGADAADRAVEAGVVDVVDDPAVGVGHRGRPAVVLAAGHLGVAVLDLRRGGRRSTTPSLRLVLAGQLAQAVVEVARPG